MSNELIQSVKNGSIKDINNLLSKGFDIDSSDADGMTPLLHACELQNFDIMKLLVDFGADVNHKNKLGHKAVDIAYWYGEFRMGCYTAVSQKMVKYLTNHGATSSVNT